jgi:hypothetical protein
VDHRLTAIIHLAGHWLQQVAVQVQLTSELLARLVDQAAAAVMQVAVTARLAKVQRAATDQVQAITQVAAAVLAWLAVMPLRVE